MMSKTSRVVTAFIQQKNTVLLLKRSNEVGSFSGYWSGISGYLENSDPLEQVWREIAEETTISREQLKLIKIGEPLDTSTDAGRFIIYPFLLKPIKSIKIKLNWENSSYRWVVPEKIPQLKTVPDLYQVWRRVKNDPL